VDSEQVWAIVCLDLPRGGWLVSLILFMWALFKEFVAFSRKEKKWWLIPLIIVLLALGAILISTANSGIAWAIYTLM
jgi:hypothetical protein